MRARQSQTVRSSALSLSAQKDLGGIAAQIVLVLGLLLAGWYVTSTTLSNLSARGITTGFAFLSRPAGFDIAFSIVPFSPSSPIWMALVVGITNTIFLVVIAAILGTLIGLLVVSLRLSSSPPAAKLAAAYISVFRNTPILLHLSFWYFAIFSALPGVRQGYSMAGVVFLNNRGLFLPAPVADYWLWTIGAVVASLPIFFSRYVAKKSPSASLARLDLALLAGVLLLLVVIAVGVRSWEVPAPAGLGFRGGAVVIPELLAVIVATSVYSSAFIAELLRGAILSVDKGQMEAAQALGLSKRVISRRVIVPQAVRIVIPPLTNQYVNMIKQTAIVAAIAFPDLMLIFGKTALTQTGQAIECLSIVTAVYLSISLLCAALTHTYSKILSAQGMRG
ncbi:ABC transporter permease subunit [Mesorhizobium sp. M3A.F.Ca.ET.174.01.1.1]|uniref:amino acid ABC transporter permease n=1 Tax=unclassified Mesorhizobium TaxID=325217 RepID=UPI001093B34B|nr:MULTISPECIES: ABC transporter permease subunit [unclassified Mesorhizobium]TGS81049.1 ABC transporter permease subunit [Mesorhizobium sp. M3A.F.Ca.ET.175.01.1.1]TGT21771.1 ABC transporter permease subunit [Mesorhizobium sp. M3A.F.Ca.ET.174.01.1.1]